jgi:membrane protein implicated in regulation of membrane protease activity
MTIAGIALDAHWWWLVAALLLGIAEILAPGFFLIWLAAAAALVGVVTFALGISAVVQACLFAVAAVAAVYAARRWMADNPKESSDPMLNDRVARMIGETVIVVEPILGGAGRVKVGDGVWNASGPDTPAGAQVRITGANSTTLTVEPL